MSDSKDDASSALVPRRRDTSSDGLGVIGLGSFFNSSKFSDFTVKTDGGDFQVHRIIISGQSEYFDRLFDRDWKESLNNTIELKEDDPGAIEAMFRFMYENDYDSSGNRETQISPMRFNVSVYRVAEKYGVATLKQLSKEKFDDATSKCWDMDDFPNTITDVYDTTECEELRCTVTHVSYQHIGALLKKEKFLQVLEQTTSFAADIVRLMAKAEAKRAAYRCPQCGAVWTADLEPGHLYYCVSCGASHSDWSSCAVK